jgi:hypothetical protein
MVVLALWHFFLIIRFIYKYLTVMKLRYIILLLFLLPVGLNSANSKDSITSTPMAVATYNLFREPSYVLFGQGIGNMEPLIFESNLVSHFMLSINKHVKWGIELTPRIALRMYNKDSYPVRTPSFKPGITFFYQLIDNKDNKRNLFTYITWFHHSNGQDGSFYSEDSVTINTATGSFSTNCVETGVFLARPTLNLDYSINYLKLYTVYNYSIDENLSGIYGRVRVFAEYKNSFNFSKAFTIFRIQNVKRKVFVTQSIRAGWICYDLINVKEFDKKRFLFKYTLSFNPSFLNDATLFLQYDYGQDEYNIYFNRTINAFRFGIASKVKFFD